MIMESDFIMLLSKSLSSICSSPAARHKKNCSKFKFPPKPQEQPKDEETKKDRHSPSPSGFSGIRNLAFILLTIYCCKLVIGCLVPVPSVRLPQLEEILPKEISVPNKFLFFFPFLAITVTWFVERSVGQDHVKLEVANTAHTVTIFTTFLTPTLFMEGVKDLDSLLVNLLLNLTYIILAMKLISYIHVNRTMRDIIIASNNNCKEAEIYPANLTYRNIFKHWISTSLVYRPSPQGSEDYKKPRKMFVFLKLMETMTLLLAVRAPYLLIANVTGSMLQAVDDGATANLLVIERFLTLSLVYFISWLISFYIIFVCFLVMLAEVLGSRDQQFYQAWWNASTMEEFWRWWNLPVHKWCVKHVYLPVVSNGMSKLVAMSATFLFSATLHEFLISVPICVCGHFAFLAFLGQGIVCKITQFWTQKCGQTAGNVLVWLILIFGNTAGVVIYYKHVVDSIQGER